jgi:hypothetical protein
MRFVRSLICLPLLCIMLLPAAVAQDKRDAFRTPFRENLSEDEKAAGLSRFWSEVRYNFANFDLVPGLDWDALYLEYLPARGVEEDARQVKPFSRRASLAARDGGRCSGGTRRRAPRPG